MAAQEAVEHGEENRDKPRKRPSDMKRNEPRRRRNRGPKPETTAIEVSANDAVAAEPIVETAAAEVPVAEQSAAPVTATEPSVATTDAVASEAVEQPVAESVTSPEPATESPEPVTAQQEPVEAAPAEPVAEIAPEPSEPAPEPTPVEPTVELDSNGIGADGRAVNDPRVAPAPVATVEITTSHPVLFKDTVEPAVIPSGRVVPRAINDPRGPASSDVIPEAAAQG